MQANHGIRIGVFLALAAAAFGQTGRAGVELRQSATAPSAAGLFSAPVMGFATSGAAAVEAILGIPGSSLLSGPLALPPGIASLRFAPGQRYAIAGQAGGAAVLTFAGTVAGTPAAIAGTAAPDRVVFSPGGGSALLHTPEPRIQVIAGLPAAPQIVRDLGPDALDASLASFAVSDDGSLVLAASANGAVVLLGANGSKTPLWTASGQPAMVFLPAGHSAALCDAPAGRFVLLQNLDQNPSSWVVADGVAGLGAAVQLAATHDGKWLVAAAPDAAQVIVVDLASQQVTATPVSDPPGRLDALRVSDTFLLSAEDGKPASILSAAGGQAAVSFVGRPHRGAVFGSPSNGTEKGANQ